MSFTEAELASMTMPAWARAKEAIADGRLDDAVALIDEGAQRVRGLQIAWFSGHAGAARHALCRPLPQRPAKLVDRVGHHAGPGKLRLHPDVPDGRIPARHGGCPT